MRFLPLSIVFFLFFLVSPAYAQTPGSEEFNFQRAYADYIFNFDIYRKANLDYELYRSQYLQFKTLKSQENAYNATLAMLKARDSTVETYLTAVRKKLDETPGADGAKKEVLFAKIDQEVTWHIDHSDSLPSAGTLDDLVGDSKKAEGRFKADIPLFYETLVGTSGGKVIYVRERQEAILASLKQKIAEIKVNGDKDTQLLERWILDTEEKITRSREKEAEAYEIITKLGSGTSISSSYNQALFKLKEAYQYLKEANSFLAEIITEIKFED
ncbi:hypothetical protein A3E15_00805 [Candidatus Woesebacteria bacterium RIFCSPHIGHO2_12_FULL_42_9]|uniref:DUF5667 domain-containing protein n=2 Tax=Candidatus Woeseibacteriota TaxID=1752722 RepID=A0A1F8AQJ1_9BACT|nr:MAG: hypothetical protein A2112_02725 [Candidatus Woesebacteria bacterium GWA1_42_12]OGM53759.1 MAG: hypothetical protein A3E15_00805 [Candidatus Woesebacteria bacterium RIFCSPHIGHO2_12_FULL_42_9]